METLYDIYREWRNLSSYRTYEEWKPGTIAMNPSLAPGSYRTYEEWKQ